MVRITIITATYNSGQTLRDTLDSVLQQDYHNFEHIIKDGGSKDDTIEICHEYEKKYAALAAACKEKGDYVPSFRIISEKDSCMYDAMNQGIHAATGDVVGILNSDDFYTSSNILKTVALRFEKYPDIDAVYGDIHYVDPANTTHLVRYYSSKYFHRSWMRMGFMPAHPSFYCRRDTYEKFKLDGHKIKGFKGDPDHAYFNTTYKIAADFENLLRLIYVHRIRTHYVCRDFVTMRRGGASSNGMASHKQINRDHIRAFKENGIYSNYLLISIRYAYKVMELALGRIRH